MPSGGNPGSANDYGETTRLLSQIRKALWHLKSGGLSQVKEWRRRELQRHRSTILWKGDVSGHTGDMLQLDLLVQFPQPVAHSLRFEGRTFDRADHELTSITRPAHKCIQRETSPGSGIYHVILLVPNHKTASTLVLRLRDDTIVSEARLVDTPIVRDAIRGEPEADLGHSVLLGTAVELVNQKFSIPEKTDSARLVFSVQGTKYPGKQLLLVRFYDSAGHLCFVN